MHAVLFDIDGTLLESAADDDRLYRQAVAQVLGDVTLRDSLHDYVNISDSGILAEIGADNGLDDTRDSDVKREFVRLLDEFISAHGPFVEIGGANEYLQRLQASNNHVVGLATGGWRESALLKLRSSGIESHGLPLATADDAMQRTEIMLHSLQQLGSEFASVTYFGDGAWDRDASSALGWNFVAVGAALGGLTAFTQAELV